MFTQLIGYFLSKKVIKYEHYTRNFKYHFENDSWVLIRLSGTEPAFRIFAETENQKEGLKTIDELKKYINVLQDKIEEEQQ